MSGIFGTLLQTTGIMGMDWQNWVMIGISCVLIYLAIVKKYEPLLLLPIGFGCLLANSTAGMMGSGGILKVLFDAGISTELFPLLIFMGIGAMTDFGPMLANPKTSLLGAAAQLGIFGAMLAALLFGFDLNAAAAIGIIGSADGPTTIYVASTLLQDRPYLLGGIAVAAYSYMALVPLIQPPIMRALTTRKERMIRMEQLREVSKIEKILFPISITIATILLIPAATPLIGMLMFGNLLRECGAVERLSKTAQNEMINIVTILLGITIGGTMVGPQFLTPDIIKIVLLGLAAFMFATAGGVLFGKLMCRLSGGKINPLIGSAGVSAVPMAARIVQRVATEEDPGNFLLMHAMGPNVAGVIGSAIAAGVLVAMVGG
ncbi:MAG: glutaconyl-CoA decarboxylase subunit beta [Thermoplasmata archaeon HGW-Thermoplasmata-2]|nr:MAG: glutaconyl-CoA decarboxylase subunit beta [Thermoplasmata archaeon HGW-Thermoplasmata-2]